MVCCNYWTPHRTSPRQEVNECAWPCSTVNLWTLKSQFHMIFTCCGILFFFWFFFPSHVKTILNTWASQKPSVTLPILGCKPLGTLAAPADSISPLAWPGPWTVGSPSFTLHNGGALGSWGVAFQSWHLSGASLPFHSISRSHCNSINIRAKESVTQSSIPTEGVLIY